MTLLGVGDDRDGRERSALSWPPFAVLPAVCSGHRCGRRHLGGDRGGRPAVSGMTLTDQGHGQVGVGRSGRERLATSWLLFVALPAAAQGRRRERKRVQGRLWRLIGCVRIVFCGGSWP